MEMKTNQGDKMVPMAPFWKRVSAVGVGYAFALCGWVLQW